MHDLLFVLDYLEGKRDIQSRMDKGKSNLISKLLWKKAIQIWEADWWKYEQNQTNSNKFENCENCNPYI